MAELYCCPKISVSARVGVGRRIDAVAEFSYVAEIMVNHLCVQLLE